MLSHSVVVPVKSLLLGRHRICFKRYFGFGVDTLAVVCAFHLVHVHVQTDSLCFLSDGFSKILFFSIRHFNV